MGFEVIDIKYTDIRGRELTFPIGNTGSRVTANITVRCRFSAGITQTLQVKKNGDKYTLTGQNPQGGPLTWESLGFVSGETVLGTLYWNDGTAGQTAIFDNEIDFINGADVYFIGAPSFSNSGPAPSDITFLSGEIVMVQNPQGFDFYFNLAPSDNPTNVYSLIDGEPTRFTVDNINVLPPMGPFVSMEQLGNKSGSGYTSILVKKLVDVAANGSSEYEFQISYEYSNYLQPEAFLQDFTVSPLFKIKALTQFNNPNAFQEIEYHPIGNIGYLGENFNGGQNNFTPSTIEWWDMLENPIPAMDFSNQSTFKITIGGFNTPVKINLGWFWRPVNEVDFKNIQTDANTNLITAIGNGFDVGTLTSFTGFSHPSGAKLQIFNIQSTVAGDQLILTGVTNPNAAFGTFFESRPGDRNYTMFVDCDRSEYANDWNSSKGVNLPVDESEMITVEVPLGPWENVVDSTFIDHNEDEFVEPVTYTEDDLTAKVRFRLPKGETFSGVTGSVIAYKAGQTPFVLESQAIGFDSLPLIDGVYPINTLIDRGFNIPIECKARYIRLERDVTLDNSTHYGVNFEYGFLCRWEYWLQLLNASNDFYDSKNKDWQHYQTNGWAIKFQMSIVTENGSYQNGYPFSIRAYDDYLGESEIDFFNLAGDPVNMPDESALTVVRVRHVLPSPYVWVAPFWGNIRVQPFENAPHWLLSTRTLTLDTANPLRPLAGEDSVTLIQTSDTTLETRCLFDPTKLPSPKITFSGRINGDSIPKDEYNFVYGDGNIVRDSNGNKLIP